jgi:hypothetical protein
VEFGAKPQIPKIKTLKRFYSASIPCAEANPIGIGPKPLCGFGWAKWLGQMTWLCMAIPFGLRHDKHLSAGIYIHYFLSVDTKTQAKILASLSKVYRDKGDKETAAKFFM